MADDLATEILYATHRALCKHDYANLTFQDITAEADTSTASIHCHYDSKDKQFGAFLDGLCEFYSAIEPANEAEYLIRLEVAQ